MRRTGGKEARHRVDLIEEQFRHHNSAMAISIHLRKLHRVVSLNLAENDRITNKGLAALRGLDSLSELNLERLDRYRHASARPSFGSAHRRVPGPSAGTAATRGPDARREPDHRPRLGPDRQDGET